MKRIAIYGKGGIGNQHFATSTMQVPKYAKPGQPAQELEVLLAEMKQQQEKMDIIQGIRKEMKNIESFSVESIGDIAYMLENKKKMKKLTDIYRIVAVNHNTDSKIIGWSINNAINKVIKDSQIDILCKSFKIDNPKKLTAKYIVNYLINYKNTF